jgi:hypothetical protein
MSKVTKLLVMLTLVGGMGAASSGCLLGVSASAEPVMHTSYYKPMYYQGYPVYYSAAGLPFYYVNGASVYIPRTYYGYGRYYNHWRVNRVHYSRWYRARGHRYRRHRRRNYRRNRRRGVRRGARRGKRRGKVRRKTRRRKRR